MSLVKYSPVTLEEILCFLMGRSFAASTMGQQLEQAEAIYNGSPTHTLFSTANEMHVKAPVVDVFKAQERAESAMLDNISVSKCVDGLTQTTRTLKDRPALAKLQKACPRFGQGELVVGCLRAYGEYASLPFVQKADAATEKNWGEPPRRSEHRALAAVYEWASARAPSTYGNIEHEEESLTMAFRSGQAMAARSRAAELYADAFLVLDEFVKQWNQRKSGFDSIGRKRRVA